MSVKLAIIVSTYNWKEALTVSLRGLFAQSRPPDEILVADDGSRDDTRECIEQLRAESPVPIRHVWQTDDGFRLAEIRNRAIAATDADYIVTIDGDIVVHPRFCEDHLSIARPDFFVQGVRAKLLARPTRRILETGRCDRWLRFVGMKKRGNLIRSPLLSHIFSRTLRVNKKILGCNMAFWRDDILQVNGYDERYVGFGGEDHDIAVRLFHAGITCRYSKHLALACHLDHPIRSTPPGCRNAEMLQEAICRQTIRCEKGIDRHLEESAVGG